MKTAIKNQGTIRREQDTVRRMMAYQKKMEKLILKEDPNRQTRRKG